MSGKLADLLQRLIRAESEPESLSDEEFTVLRQEISSRLSKGHQIRFNRLTFFSSETVDHFFDDDEIPF